jgi:HEAT repeat protein
MRGHQPVNPPPSLKNLEGQGRTLLRQFDPHKIVYLSREGEWRDSPPALRDRISHALLFHLWAKGEKEADVFFNQACTFLAAEDAWVIVQKIETALQNMGSSSDRAPFLVLLEVVLWIIEREAARLNAGAPAPDWNVEARAFKTASQKTLQSLDGILDRALTSEQKERFLEIEAGLKTAAAAVISPLCRLLAEEERISASLDRLLREAADQSRKDEVYSLIVEKIQPSMGIVTHLSPALFFPGLRLLLDDRIDPASGIPYMASIILSVFQDPRSAETLLKALETYPLSYTKIRENIIYTLGQLREPRAVNALIEVLNAPDEFRQTASGEAAAGLLLEQKEEAIWALGKIGFDAVKAVPALAGYADHSSAKLKTYLAWTLGEIGKTQKEAAGGVSADVVIALLKLLKEKNKQIFEEAVSALKKIDLPEFVHSLYLYHVGAISILGLKPAQRGLYELSETLHYLLRTKKRTIMAVNGDSGTGKTYFCQAIAGGFAGIRPEEILYLMRDTKRGQRVFNRLLGLRWLRRHIDPSYYQDYPVSEDEDDPQAYFRQFLAENADKRLIILDGCRDRHYFQKVIDFFYLQGELDVEVNFRANFSTRRLNLETRESALESVKLHLQFLEEPALEDTSFYQEGLVILYDLDNSHASRLNSEETRELFETRRIDSWGEFIRIGDFSGEQRTSPCCREKLDLREEDFAEREEAWPALQTFSFTPQEKKLKLILNDDLETEPNLLKTIPLDDIRPRQIRFYAQDQIAGLGDKGSIFVLTFLDNRIFRTSVEGASNLALLGRTLYLAVPGRGLLRLSFEQNDIIAIKTTDPFILKVVPLPPDRVVTAHQDGTVRVWDFLDQKVLALSSGLPEISALAVDQSGRIHAGGEDGRIKRWDLDKKTAHVISGPTNTVGCLHFYPFGKILAVEGGGPGKTPPSLRIIDFENEIVQIIPAPAGGTPNGINVYYDGRIIAGFGDAGTAAGPTIKNLFIISPREDGCSYLALSGHPGGTQDCLAMGPKIITCGMESDGRSAMRVWGSDFFVKTERGKLFIKP